MSKLLDFVGSKERSRRSGLEHLQRAVNSDDDSNAITLLNVLMKEENKGQKNDKNTSSLEKVFRNTLGFILKVIVVMGLLYMAALVFAYLEDGDHNVEIRNDTMKLEVFMFYFIYLFPSLKSIITHRVARIQGVTLSVSHPRSLSFLAIRYFMD